VTRPRDFGFRIECFPTRTRTLPPATHTNAYALGGSEVLIVEPAPEDKTEQKAMIDWVQAMRRVGRRPLAIVITHHHPDHIGAAAVMQKELGLPLWAHAATQALMPHLSIDKSLVDGDRIVLDDPLQTWEVLHTPGHASGHLCLFERDLGVLLLGDMVATKSTILIEPSDGDMREYLKQLERLAALEARVGLPAHGEPIEQPSRFLRATHAHRMMRENKIIDVLRSTAAFVALDEMLALVYDDTSVVLWPLAKKSLLAHLEKLQAEGKVHGNNAGYYGWVGET